MSQDSDAVEAKNFGQSGVMVLRGKKQYTDTDIYQEVVAWAPDVAIIWLGINDAKEKDNGKFKRKQFIDDYRDMLKQMTSDIERAAPSRSGKPAKGDRRRREAGIFTL